MTRRRNEASDPVDEAVARALDQIELEDPPEDLKPNVLRAIGTRPEPARRGWFETLRAGLHRRFVAQLYPFAAGAAVGAIAIAILSNGGTRWGDGAAISGAMVPGRSHPALVDQQRFELGRANVRFEVTRSGGRAAVAVVTEGQGPVVVTLQLHPDARVERLTAVPSASGGTAYGPGWIQVRTAGRASGRDRTEIGLVLESGAGDAPIRVGIASSEGSIRGALQTRGTGL